jgi:hypothetical protein
LPLDLAQSHSEYFRSLYRRCPPKVLIEVNLPALAHLVTVFGSTLNKDATSAGVSNFSWLLEVNDAKFD